MKFLRSTTLAATFACLLGKTYCISPPITTFNDNDIPLCKQRFSLIRSAEELIGWKMYDPAIPAYANAIQSLPATQNILKTNLTLRLAQTHLILGQSQKALEALETIPVGQGEPEKNHLTAIAYIQLDKPEEAIKLLNAKSKNNRILLAMALDLIGKYEDSLKVLSHISKQERGYDYSRLLFTKIALSHGSYQQANEELKSLEERMSPAHPLYPEVLWMKGITQYQLDNISQAILYFEEALTLPSFQSHQWYTTCIAQLAHTYLVECYAPKRTLEDKKRLLSRAEQMVREELNRRPGDHLTLALVKVLLAKNFYFPSKETLNQCNALLADEKHLNPRTTKTEALLLKAQIATDYSQREKYLSTLTSTKNTNNSWLLAYGWLLRGHNEREMAYQGGQQAVKKHLKLALSYYKQAYQLFSKASAPKTREAIGSWAQTAHDLADVHYLKEIYDIAHHNILNHKDSSESYYIKSLIATHLYELSGHHNYLNDAIDDLQLGLVVNPSDKEIMQLSLLMGKIYFLKNSFDKAESILTSLANILPDSPMASESLYWSGRSAEMLPSPIHPPQEYYKRCYTDYPSSPFAAESYFRMYTYQQYLHGEKEARKHLEKLLVRYPDSRFVMDSQFLLALDSKRDRKTSKGKWISKSNVTKAIDHFQEVSANYQRFKSQNLLEDNDIAHYDSLELRATLEKALCNLTIARQSSGAKKHIYLQYAKEVFTDLIGRIPSPHSTDYTHDTLEEAIYGLAQTEFEAEHYDEAEQLIRELIHSYEGAKVTRGYYLSRSWHDLSQITLARSLQSTEPAEVSYRQSLEYLKNAEDCAKGRVLSTDQTIDLWLKISHCHKMLGQYDQSMRYLTKAIDEDAVSHLRLKAMYLRAEIYELQGRFELSRKQLEATAKKGGEWGQKAKDKLGEIYGYH